MKKSHHIKFDKKIVIRNLLLLFICVSLSVIAVKIISSFKKPNKNNNTAKVLTPATSNVKKINTEVLLSAVGDCTIGTDSKFSYASSLPAMAQQSSNGFGYYFKNVRRILSKDDVTIANLETTFTNSNDKADKQFNFKADSDYAKSLTLGSIEGVNISNNHIYDYKQKGFVDTKNALKKEKVNYFGEGSKWTTKNKRTVHWLFRLYEVGL